MCIVWLSHSPNILTQIKKAFAPAKSPVQISFYSTHAKCSAVWQRLLLSLLWLFWAAVNFVRLESWICKIRVKFGQFSQLIFYFFYMPTKIERKKRKKKRKKPNKKKKFSLYFERQMGFIRSSLGSCISPPPSLTYDTSL